MKNTKNTKNMLLIQKYLEIYNKNPHSEAFVLLADLYRKNGEIDKAFSFCRRGLKRLPQSAKGHIALALILLDMDKPEGAIEALEKALEYSPENILAYKLLGQTWLRLKNAKKTLSAYKMVLLLDPQNQKAQKIVEKLASAMTTTPQDTTGFSFKSLKDTASHIPGSSAESQGEQDDPIIHPLPKVQSQKEEGQLSDRLNVIEANKEHTLSSIKFSHPSFSQFSENKNTKTEQFISVEEKTRRQRRKKIQTLRKLLSRIEKFSFPSL